MKIIPPYLNKGDCIGIIAPARSISEEKINFASEVIKKWGLTLVLSKNLTGIYHQYSGTIAQRSSDFQQMIHDTNIKAILCAGGGYGSVQVLNHIDLSPLKKHPKWLVGFSDITVFHSVFQKQINLASIHATMPVKFDNNNISLQSMESLRKALFGELDAYEIEYSLMNINGIAEGELVGGNLSILYSLLGTPYDIDYNDKILFIEEVDEYLYHIERMIYSFKMAGKLNQIKGLLVGTFSKINDNDIPFGKNEKQIIHNAVKEYGIPIVFDFQAGHNELNLALYLGLEARITSEENLCSLNYLK